jgi:hypothetical protein
MNTYIKPVAHQAKRPVTIERDVNDVIVIEGVKYAGDLFRCFAMPGSGVLYAAQNDGDSVRLTMIRTVKEAMEFFEEIEGQAQEIEGQAQGQPLREDGGA